MAGIYTEAQKKATQKWVSKNKARKQELDKKWAIKNYYWKKICKEFRNILLENI
jgi:hypothetical protein